MPQTIDNLLATWNNGATTFTFFKANITDTASAAGSLLMDLQTNTGGAATSRFSVAKTGTISSAATGASASVVSAANFKIYSNSYFAVESGGGIAMTLERNATTGLRVGSTMPIGWSSTVDAWNNAPDTILTRKAAASLRLGAADTTLASAVAQTLGVQSVTGTDVSAATLPFRITGAQGTGTGAGGSIEFQVAPAGVISGTAQNALSTVFTVRNDASLVYNAPSQTNWNFGQYQSGLVLGSASGSTLNAYYFRGLGLTVQAGGFFGFTGGGDATWNTGGGPDTALYRDAAGTLAMRNGANAQGFNIYNTYTSASVYERGFVRWSGNTFQIGTEFSGGSSRELQLRASGPMFFYAGGDYRWYLPTTGHLWAYVDNQYDIGNSGSNRPRNVYVATDMFVGNNVSAANFTFNGGTRSYINSPSSGVLGLYNNAGSDFGRLQFGGTTSSFPALKRSSTTLQARLADDSAFAPVQGKITTDTAYTAGDPVTTGYLVVYDSAGVAYKIPAVAL